jgi:3-hydroxybutyryl-CoA dehydrogenase
MPNTYYQRPELPSVELMSTGWSRRGDHRRVVATATVRLRAVHVRRESDGFIFNRIWAAIKRERLMVVEGGVAPPEGRRPDVADLHGSAHPAVPAHGPRTPRRGLSFEEYYAEVRPALREGPRKLLRAYIDEARLASAAAAFYRC